MAILTVTLNPALDLETTVPELKPREKLRCTEPRRDPGGGGINVARAIHVLGGAASAVVALNGPAGREIAESLGASGIDIIAVPAPGPTRSNMSVIETSSGDQYRFISPGPDWTLRDLEKVSKRLRDAVSGGDIVVLSGSLPPGLPPSALVGLATDLMARGARVVVDTSGDALVAMAASAKGLDILRMDAAEGDALFGRPLHRASDTAAAAATLIAAGVAKAVIIARGREGSVLVSGDGRWAAPAAEVPVVSVTGAGDSFVAAATLALSRGADWPGVLLAGCSAASAAVTTPATELCDPAVYADLLAETRAEPL